MPKQVGDVIACRVEPVKLVIQLERQPGERMPVGVVRGAERPPGASPAQACLNVRVPRHVTMIVVIEKFAGADLPEGGQGEHCQAERDQLTRGSKKSSHRTT